MVFSRKEKDKDIGISTWLPRIWYPEQPMIKPEDGIPASEDVFKNILKAKEK